MYVPNTGTFQGPRTFEVDAWSFGLTANDCISIVAFDDSELLGNVAAPLRTVEITEEGGKIVVFNESIDKNKTLHPKRKKATFASGGTSILVYAQTKKNDKWTGKVYYESNDGDLKQVCTIGITSVFILQNVYLTVEFHQCGKFNEGMAVDIAANEKYGVVCTAGGEIQYCLSSEPTKWYKPKEQEIDAASVETLDDYFVGATATGSKILVIDPEKKESFTEDLEPAVGGNVDKIAFMAGSGSHASFAMLMNQENAKPPAK